MYRERKGTLDMRNRENNTSTKYRNSSNKKEHEENNNDITERMISNSAQYIRLLKKVLPEDGLIWPKHVAL
jgi:hypothetical protein